MARRWQKWSVGLLGWLVGPSLLWGAVTGTVGLAWALLAGLPAVVIALISLAALTVGVALAHLGLTLYERLNGRQEERMDYSPADRRGRLNNTRYPRRDDRLDLGERCSTFAMKVRVFNEEQEWRRERAIGRIADELRQSETELDPCQARKDAEARFGRGVQMSYRAGLRDEGMQLFEKAHEQGEIAQKPRRLVEAPLGLELNELPWMFEELARRLGYKAPARAYGPAPEELAGRLDSLMREGVELVDKLNVPVTPQQVGDFWKLEGGDAPDKWWEKSDEFTERVRTLLLECHPALLTDYRDGYNAHVREERKKLKGPSVERDRSSDGEKMLGLANFERSGPRRVVEAALEGLAAAHHRLAVSPASVA